MMTLDTYYYRLYCTTDYDILLRYFFLCINMTKYKFLSNSLTTYPVTIEQRFVIIITPFCDFYTLDINYIYVIKGHLIRKWSGICKYESNIVL